MKTVTGILLAASFLVPACASATIITFDEIVLSTDIPAIANGYSGLDWDNFRYLKGSIRPPGAGYFNSVVSPDNIAFNGGGVGAGFSRAAAFTFQSAYFTAAWRDGMTVEVTGFLDGTSLYSKSFLVDTNGPSFQSFGWTGVDAISFLSFGGTDNRPGDGNNGTQFAMDNLSIDPRAVPEPASIALIGLGLLGLIRSRRSTPGK